MNEFDFSEFDPDLDPEESEEENQYSDLVVYMIEVVDGVPSQGVEGLYLHSVGLIKMIERDIWIYEENGFEDEAKVLSEFLDRIRLTIAQRGIQDE